MFSHWTFTTQNISDIHKTSEYYKWSIFDYIQAEMVLRIINEIVIIPWSSHGGNVFSESQEGSIPLLWDLILRNFWELIAIIKRLKGLFLQNLGHLYLVTCKNKRQKST